ncbi:hypothetical protein QAD02_017688 [Eretmocerus hayati]|uniref:Uncharacterized protein n=1 Tax=Eretmocerus hayati TaxID=131215 RepID=A0ACC2PGF0_9HYME|nr:hypothetical protein QAD02_017688 [Eretmocerus hayati]
MEFRSKKLLIIGVILLLTILQINAKTITKRQTQNGEKSGTGPPSSNSGSSKGNNDMGQMTDLDLGPLLDSLAKVPLFGRYFEENFEKFIEGLTRLDKMTNGVISRILGGALPCEVSVPKGIVCSGVSREGVYSLIEDMMNDIPGIILPGPTKMLILASIRMLINPMADFLFGGLPQSSQS